MGLTLNKHPTDHATCLASRPAAGWPPASGFLTEDGSRPEFDTLYGAVELVGGYKARTEANARDSDGTVWFGNLSSPGGVAKLRACHALGRPVFEVQAGVWPSELVAWIVGLSLATLNVVGNRESTAPEIVARVERFLLAALSRVE